MSGAAEVLRDGFPYDVLPTGWYQVAWSDEFALGDVRPLRYFERDLVCYRGADGTVAVLDAHCPHMGAHLGIGGRVEGCDVVCPFHMWRWGPDGRNTLVPSEGGPTSRRRVGSWSVAESNGMVWVWFDDAGRAPLWAPLAERRAERAFLPVWPGCVHRWEALRGRPQYMIENVVDLEHFPSVHYNKSEPEIVEIRDGGHSMAIDMRTVHGYGKEKTWLTPDGPVETVMTTELYGMATIFSDWGPGGDDSYLITNMTPIDKHHLDMFMTVMVLQDPESTNREMPEGRALRRVEQQRKQTQRDVPIWENLVYNARVPYTRAEGKYMVDIKRWASRFYEPDKTPHDNGQGASAARSASA